MANLLQIFSAFGRAMETVDREAMANAVFPVLLRRKAEGASKDWLRRVVAATAEGYPFPTDLDLDAPVAGLAPPSQADTVHKAVAEDWSRSGCAGNCGRAPSAAAADCDAVRPAVPYRTSPAGNRPS